MGGHFSQSNDPLANLAAMQAATRAAVADNPVAQAIAEQAATERHSREAEDRRRAAVEERDARRRTEREEHERRLGDLELERRELELDAYRRDEAEREVERTRAARGGLAAASVDKRVRSAELAAHTQLARVESLEALAARVERDQRVHVIQHVVLGVAVGAAAGLVCRAWFAARGAA